jgi:PKHD-type hydroxylase
VHQVTPVTRGARIASFFWVESMVRSHRAARAAVRHGHGFAALRQSALGESDPAVVGLTGTYHNLLRMWADA